MCLNLFFEYIFWIYILDIYFGYIFLIYILDIYVGYIFLIDIFDIYSGYLFWIYFCIYFVNIYLEHSFGEMRNWKLYIFHYYTAPQLELKFHLWQKTWTGFYPKLCVFMECALNFFQGRYPIFLSRKVP